MSPESREGWEGNCFQENHLVGFPERRAEGSQELAILPPHRGATEGRLGSPEQAGEFLGLSPETPGPAFPWQRLSQSQSLSEAT